MPDAQFLIKLNVKPLMHAECRYGPSLNISLVLLQSELCLVRELGVVLLVDIVERLVLCSSCQPGSPSNSEVYIPPEGSTTLLEG